MQMHVLPSLLLLQPACLGVYRGPSSFDLNQYSNKFFKTMSLKIKKVLISEPVDSVCENFLTQNGIEVTTKVGLAKDDLLKLIQDYDGLVVRSATKVTADVIAAGKQLKIIGRAGTGFDNIDCEAATKHGVLVINAPGGNTLSAAELTCGMVVSLSRNIPQACASMKSGKWDRKSFMGNELLDKTLAIIGLGRIGREVAHRMQSYGMKTIGFDPLVPADASRQFGVESMELENIWPLADYITIHTPLIPQTRNLINDDVFAKCRKGMRIVNCARGGIIDEDALVRALESGQCGGAGLDVYLEEPPKNTKLIQHPNVICTPHLGASTAEAQTRVAEEIALQFVDLIAGKSAHGIVNSPTFCQSICAENKPWVSLCIASGAALATLFKVTETSSSQISVSLSVQGSDFSKKVQLLNTAVLIGMIKQRFNIEANFVNAPTLAKEKGLEISSSNDTPVKAANAPIALIVSFKSGNESHTIVTTFRGDDSVLLAIDGSIFVSPPTLVHNAVICRGKHSPDNAVKLLSTLIEKDIVSSASWSTVLDGNSWCVINSPIKCEKMPNQVSSYLDFWGQLNL